MSNCPAQIDQASDIDLRRRIEIQLSVRAGLRQIHVDVVNGVVYLEGTVRSIHDRRLATYGCRRVAGVRAVENRIVVDNQESVHASPEAAMAATCEAWFA